MGRKTCFSPQQHTLAFGRQEIWQRLAGEQRRQCCELCVQLLRAVLQHEEGERSEADDDRKDSR